MSRVKNDQPLMPSLLDRLLDDEPNNNQDAPQARHQVLRELKQSVRRDLENLLNTRWRCTALIMWISCLASVNASSRW